MPGQSPFDWLIKKLESNEHVESAVITSEDLLYIERTEGSELTVTKTTQEKFSIDDIKAILDKQNADFILHTSKEPFVDAKVFEYLNPKQKVLGGFGDVIRLINQGHNWPYFPTDVGFILRGLKQHTKVTDVRRLDNKRYEISRLGLETVIIIALNDYDIGIESIRSAVDAFGPFHAVLKSNPNGKITRAATEIAELRGIRLFKWAELLGNLNFKWNWKK